MMASPLASSVWQSAKEMRQIIPKQAFTKKEGSSSIVRSLRMLSTSSASHNVSESTTHAGTTSQQPSSILSGTSSSSSSSSDLIEKSKSEALSLLRSQPVHYVVCSMVGRTLLLHERDVFSIPRLNDVCVGDVLELDRIHEVGSRDFTLRAQDPMTCRTKGLVALKRKSVSDLLPSVASSLTASGEISSPILKESQSWAARLRPSGLAHVGACLGPESIRVRCTVVEHTKGPMELIVKKKRRKGYKRTIRHKQTYTRLRVESIRVGDGVVEN